MNNVLKHWTMDKNVLFFLIFTRVIDKNTISRPPPIIAALNGRLSSTEISVSLMAKRYI